MKKGITLIEILVSTILIAITLIGMANLFVSGKRYIAHSRARMTGGEMGKIFLDPLANSVRQDDWDAALGDYTTAVVPTRGLKQTVNPPPNPLGTPDPVPQNINGVNYQPFYIIDNLVPGDPTPQSQMRRVRVNIHLTEPQP